MTATGGRRRRAAALLALAGLAALAAGACGGRQRSNPPRSSCADAAASLVQGLRRVAPADAERAPALEPRFAEVCRTSRWRPNVIRCFALARDAEEHRICSRRLEPAQRDEARVVQGALYGPSRARPQSGEAKVSDACLRLLPVREELMACPRLLPPDKLRVATAVEALMRAAFEAGRAGDPRPIAELARVCERMTDQVRSLLVEVGC